MSEIPFQRHKKNTLNPYVAQRNSRIHAITHLLRHPLFRPYLAEVYDGLGGFFHVLARHPLLFGVKSVLAGE
jgi:hypothetical protein